VFNFIVFSSMPIQISFKRYGLGDRSSVPDSDDDGTFSFQFRVQTGSGTHPVSHPMGAGRGLTPGTKRLGREAGHLPPSNSEV
jgi:hypothetical protein